MIRGSDSLEEEERRSDPAAARKEGMDCLARRDYGRAELVEKLLERGFEPETARAAVERLAAEGLQDDRRLAESLVASRIEKGKGPLRIRLDLTGRGIDPEIAEQALAGAGVDWSLLARRVRERRFGAGLPADFPEKARQMRFLQSRGFEPDQIAAAMSAADD